MSLWNKLLAWFELNDESEKISYPEFVLALNDFDRVVQHYHLSSTDVQGANQLEKIKQLSSTLTSANQEEVDLLEEIWCEILRLIESVQDQPTGSTLDTSLQSIRLEKYKQSISRLIEKIKRDFAPVS